MKSFARTLMLSAALIALPTWATVEVKGAKFNDTYALNAQALQLNGVGVRVKVIIDVYAAGLYLVKKERSADAAINQAGPKSLQIVLLRDLSGEDFADAMLKGFKKNLSEAEQAHFQPKIDEVKGLMMAFGKVKKGAVIHIDFAPGTGTRVMINGEKKGPDVSGDDFYTAILKIWLGPHPADGELKDALLGGQ